MEGAEGAGIQGKPSKNYSVLLTLEDDNPGTPRYVLGTTALMVAAHYNNVEAVKNLLAEVGARDSQGFTALMYAARRGHTQAVSLFADRGRSHE